MPFMSTRSASLTICSARSRPCQSRLPSDLPLCHLVEQLLRHISCGDGQQGDLGVHARPASNSSCPACRLELVSMVVVMLSCSSWGLKGAAHRGGRQGE